MKYSPSAIADVDDTIDSPCEVPGCKHASSSSSPGNWCEEHWQIWWAWDAERKEPEWMRDPVSRREKTRVQT